MRRDETNQYLNQDQPDCFAEDPAGLEEEAEPDELDFTE